MTADLNTRACTLLHAALTAAGKAEMAKEWEPMRDKSEWQCQGCGRLGLVKSACPQCGDDGAMERAKVYPDIANDANVAHRALDHMRALGYMAEFYMWPGDATGASFSCRIRHAKKSFPHIYFTFGDTAPAAIAAAIIAALGHQ